MDKEELKQKAEEYAQKYINHKMAIHDIFDLEVVQKDITRLLAEFAEEATKTLQEENRSLLESCEGATMMYKHLTKAKEIIKKYLVIGVGGKITQNYLDVTKEAEQFLKED